MAKGSSQHYGIIIDVDAELSSIEGGLKKLQGILKNLNIGEAATKSFNGLFNEAFKEISKFSTKYKKELNSVGDIRSTEQGLKKITSLYDKITTKINALDKNKVSFNFSNAELTKLSNITAELETLQSSITETKNKISEMVAEFNNLTFSNGNLGKDTKNILKDAKKQKDLNKEINDVKKKNFTKKNYKAQTDDTKRISASLDQANKKALTLKESLRLVGQTIQKIGGKNSSSGDISKALNDYEQNYINQINQQIKANKDLFKSQQAAKGVKNTGRGVESWVNPNTGKSIKDLKQELNGLTAILNRVKSSGNPLKELFNIKGEIKGNLQAVNQETSELERNLNEVNEQARRSDFSKFKQATNVLSSLVSSVNKAEQETEELNQEFDNIQTSGINRVDQSFEGFIGTILEASGALNKMDDTLDNIDGQRAGIDNINNSFSDLTRNIQYFFSVDRAFDIFRDSIRYAFNAVKELDKAMTDIAVVTNYTVGDVWETIGKNTDLANKLGTTILGTYETSKLYYQQGLSEEDVYAASEETLKMARIAGMDYAEATDYMTAAVRGFKLEMEDATRVNDVFSKLAAISAADTGEIADALTRTASIANAAGMELETTSAFLTQMIETTREAPENLGTAMKTIIARFQEMKKAPSEMELVDGEEVNVNKIESALKSIGVALRDEKGQFRDLDDVFLEISQKWDTLDKNTQRYIATVAAGSRQQSRFIAMMDNYSRTVELVDAAYNSAGAGQEQYQKTLDSLESKLNQLKNAWQEFITGILNSDLIKGAIDFATEILTKINDLTDGTNSWWTALSRIAIVLASLKAGASTVRTLFKFINPRNLANIKNLTKSLGGSLIDKILPNEKGYLLKTLLGLDPNGKPGDKLTAFKMIGGQLKNWFKTAEIGKKAGNWTKLLFGNKGMRESAAAFLNIGTSAEGAAGGVSKLGTALVSTPWGWIAAAILAVAAAITAIAIAAHKNNIKAGLLNQLEESKEATKALNDAASEAKTTLNDLLSAKAGYDKLQSSLDNLIIGSEKWRDTLNEINQQVLELIEKFPQLAAGLERNSDGSLSINEDIFNQHVAETEKIATFNSGAAILSNLYTQQLESEIQRQSNINALTTGDGTVAKTEQYGQELTDFEKQHLAVYEKYGNKLLEREVLTYEEFGKLSLDLQRDILNYSNVDGLYGYNRLTNTDADKDSFGVYAVDEKHRALIKKAFDEGQIQGYHEGVYELKNIGVAGYSTDDIYNNILKYETGQAKQFAIDAQVQDTLRSWLISQGIDQQIENSDLKDNLINAVSSNTGLINLQEAKDKIWTRKNGGLFIGNDNNTIDQGIWDLAKEVWGEDYYQKMLSKASTDVEAMELLYKELYNVAEVPKELLGKQNRGNLASALAAAFEQKTKGEDLEAVIAKINQTSDQSNIETLSALINRDFANIDTSEFSDFLTDAVGYIAETGLTFEELTETLGFSSDALQKATQDYVNETVKKARIATTQAMLSGAYDTEDEVAEAFEELDFEDIDFISQFSEAVKQNLGEDAIKNVWAKVPQILKSQNQEVIDQTKKLFNDIDWSDPIDQAYKLREAAMGANKEIAELAQGLLNAGGDAYSSGELFKSFIESSDFEKLEEDLDGFLESNKKITSKNIKDLAKNCEKLNKLLKQGKINAEGLARALMALKSGDAVLAGLTSRVLEAISAFGTFEEELSGLHEWMSEFDPGLDSGEGIEFFNDMNDKVKELIDGMEYGNPQLENYLEAFFGEDVLKGFTGDALITRVKALQKEMEILTSGDGYGFWERYAKAGYTGSNDFATQFIEDGELIIDVGKNTTEQMISMIQEMQKAETGLAISREAAAAILFAGTTHNTEARWQLQANDLNAAVDGLFTAQYSLGKLGEDWIITEQEIAAMAAATGNSIETVKQKISAMNKSIKIVDWFDDEGVELTGEKLIDKINDTFKREGKGILDGSDAVGKNIQEYLSDQFGLDSVFTKGLSGRLYDEKALKQIAQEIGLQTEQQQNDFLDAIGEKEGINLSRTFSVIKDGVLQYATVSGNTTEELDLFQNIAETESQAEVFGSEIGSKLGSALLTGLEVATSGIAEILANALNLENFNTDGIKAAFEKARTEMASETELTTEALQQSGNLTYSTSEPFVSKTGNNYVEKEAKEEITTEQVIKVSADPSGIKEVLTHLTDEGIEPIPVPVQGDTTGLAEDINNAAPNASITVVIDADTSALEDAARKADSLKEIAELDFGNLGAIDLGSIEGLGEELRSEIESLGDEVVHVQVNDDGSVSEINGDITDLPADHHIAVTDDGTVMAIHGAISSLPTSVTVTVNYVEVGKPAVVGGSITVGVSGRAKGTKDKHVSAYSSGAPAKEGLPSNETSLVGEEGYELAQNGDKAFLLGENGPEITKLEKGTRIWSHEDTKKILDGNSSIKNGLSAFAGGNSFWTPDQVQDAHSAKGQGSSGGGGSVSSDGGDDPYESALDYYWNFIIKLKKLNADLEDLLNERDRLLEKEARALAAGDLDAVAKAQEALAKKNEDVLKQHQKVVDEQAYYISSLNGGMQKLEGMMGEYGDAVSKVDGVLKVNWDSYNALGDDAKEKMDGLIEEWEDYYDRLEESKDAIQEIIDYYRDLAEEYRDMHDEARDDFSDLIDQLKDVMVQMREDEIKATEEYYDKLVELDEDYLDALRRNVDERRRLRDREDNYQELSEKQRRLSLLRRDSSGVYKNEIMTLEEEIASMQQDLADQETDNVLDKMDYDLQLKQEYFTKSIELMEDALEQDIKNGLIAQEAERLLREAPEEAYRILTECNAEYLEMSTTQQAIFVEELKNQMIEMHRFQTEYYLKMAEEMEAIADVILNQLIDAINKVSVNVNYNYTYVGSSGSSGGGGGGGGGGGSTGGSTSTGSTGSSVSKKDLEKKLKDYYNNNYVPGMAASGSPYTQSLTLSYDDWLSNQGSSASKHLFTAEEQKVAQNKGWFGFSEGGIVDYTGPAMVHGSPSKPEAFLSAADTRNFGILKEVLDQVLSKKVSTPIQYRASEKSDFITNKALSAVSELKDTIKTLVKPTGSSSTIASNSTLKNGRGDCNIYITVDEISSDYSVDRAINRVKEQILSSSSYRNVNLISRTR